MPRVQFFRIILGRIGLSKQKLWIQISRQNEEQIKLLLRKCRSKTHERQYYRFPMTNSYQNQQNNKAQLHDEIAMVLPLKALKNKDTSFMREWHTSSFLLLNWYAIHKSMVFNKTFWCNFYPTLLMIKNKGEVGFQYYI